MTPDYIIHKQGRIFTGTCQSCGCVFDASPRLVSYAKDVACPNCGNITKVKEKTKGPRFIGKFDSVDGEIASASFIDMDKDFKFDLKFPASVFSKTGINVGDEFTWESKDGKAVFTRLDPNPTPIPCGKEHHTVPVQGQDKSRNPLSAGKEARTVGSLLNDNGVKVCDQTQ